MKKILYLVIAAFLGITVVILLNLVIKDLTMSGLNLPFGWEGPHYWLTAGSPNDHSSGLPFTILRYSANEGAYYTSTLALGLDIVSGAGLGLGAKAIIQKRNKRTP